MLRGRASIRLIWILGLSLSIVVTWCVMRAIFGVSRLDAIPATALATVDDDAAARLSEALRFPTVSATDGNVDAQAFLDLHAYLERSFPLAHGAMQREIVAGYSLLYTWPGTDPALTPVLLAAHLDVVPAADEGWTRPPFAGRIEDGYVWGRGAMDDKAALLALLEAVEHLAAQGLQPQRTVYFAFGHDEEVGGNAGAAAIARLLHARIAELEAVFDEGLLVTDGILPGLDRPAALIGTAEKGYADVELLVQGEGGHSSMPPRETAVGVLARALDRLQRNRFPATLTEPVGAMSRDLAAYMPFGQRLALANLWLFEPLVLAGLAQSPATDALIRTTTAPTLLQGGTKANVLPRQARAVINFRVLPGETVASVTERVRAVVADERVQIRLQTQTAVDPSTVSRTDAWGYAVLARTVRETFGEVAVAPSLVIPATDSRHYAPLARDVLRFRPMTVKKTDLARFHGIDERIAVDDYARMIRFYVRLLENLGLSSGHAVRAWPVASSWKGPVSWRGSTRLRMA